MNLSKILTKSHRSSILTDACYAIWWKNVQNFGSYLFKMVGFQLFIFTVSLIKFLKIIKTPDFKPESLNIDKN